MATASVINSLFSEWNSVIKQLNDSDSIVVSKIIAKDIVSSSEGINFGNGSKYVSQINESFESLSNTIGTPIVRSDIEQLNNAIQDYKNYLETSWWQFGSGQRPQTMTLPKMTELGS